MTLSAKVGSFFMSVVTESTIKQPELRTKNSEYFCRYLGLIALFAETDTSPEHLEQQIITELAESIDAEMGTHGKPILLVTSGNDLCDRDGRSMSKSAQAWAELQRTRAMQDPGLAWFARIAEIESLEHEDVFAFSIQANIGDSLTVVSPFPEEAYQSTISKDKVGNEGYRVDTKRSFVRVYEKTELGLSEHIQSIDSSSLAVWNETLAYMFGAEKVETTEAMLVRRTITKGVPAQEIIEQIAATYDMYVGKQESGTYRYGRNPGGSIEANAFVRKNMDIVHDVMTQLAGLGATGHTADEIVGRILYNSKALIKQRLESGRAATSDVRLESEAAGASAAAAGTVFYGCSGASYSFAEQATAMSHEITFSLMNGMEGVAIKRCPQCGKECFTAVRDKSNGRFYCTNTQCSGYSAEKINAAYGISAADDTRSFTETFADALIELFAGKKK